MNTASTLALSFFVFAAAHSAATTISINFDVNPGGQAINAPATFDSASPLRNTYSALGVHFAGPTSTQGGAILNDSTFTAHALSGPNFLAFSGVESSEFSAPETITFDTPVTAFSIYASGLGHFLNFTIQAYDGGGTLVDSSTLGTANWNQLSASSDAGIRRVVLSVVNAGTSTFVFDDLAANTVPAPASLMLLGGGGVLLGRRRR